MWSLETITAPTAEPLDLYSEVAQQVRLQPFEVTAQLAALIAYVAAARALCETFTGRQLITASYELWLESWYERGVFDCASNSIRIPNPPCADVTEIRYLDTAGVEQTWDSDEWELVAPSGAASGFARVFPAFGISWPSARCQPGSIKIAFTAGYGSTYASVPTALRAGMLLPTAELYDRRAEAAVGTIVNPNLMTSHVLWTPFRVFW